MAAPDPGMMTIEELSRRSNVSTRNIRAFQSKNLLQGPERRGRVGYYTAKHLDRLHLIRALQERTFGLAAIKELLDAHEERLHVSDVLGLSTLLATPWVDHEAEFISEDELARRVPELASNDRLLQEAIRMNLLVPRDRGFGVPRPELFAVGVSLAASGVPLPAILGEAEALIADLDRIAARFFDVVKPIIKRELMAHPPGEAALQHVTTALEDLRVLAARALESTFRHAMDNAEAGAIQGMARLGDTRRKRRSSASREEGRA